MGKLTFSTEDILGYGAFGTVFRGKLEGTIDDVAIKRIDKTKVTNDFEIKFLEIVGCHENIVRFYHKEEDTNFM